MVVWLTHPFRFFRNFCTEKNKDKLLVWLVTPLLP